MTRAVLSFVGVCALTVGVLLPTASALACPGADHEPKIAACPDDKGDKPKVDACPGKEKTPAVLAACPGGGNRLPALV